MYAEHARGAGTGGAAAAGAGGGAGAAGQVTPSLEDIRLAVQARTEGAQVPKEVRHLTASLSLLSILVADFFVSALLSPPPLLLLLPPPSNIAPLPIAPFPTSRSSLLPSSSPLHPSSPLLRPSTSSPPPVPPSTRHNSQLHPPPSRPRSLRYPPPSRRSAPHRPEFLHRPAVYTSAFHLPRCRYRWCGGRRGWGTAE